MTNPHPARRALCTAVILAFVAPPITLLAQNAVGAGLRAQPKNGRPYVTSVMTPESETGSSGAPASIAIEGGARRMLVGATVPHVVRVRDAAGAERRDVPVQWTSSNPTVASVNQFGVTTAVRPGAVTVRVTAGALAAERRYTVEANPIRSLTLSITADRAKTGDLVEVSATAFDSNGYKVANVPFLYTFTATVEDSAVGQLAPAELDQKGRFVAQKAGDYQIIAIAPGLVAHRTVRVANRDVTELARSIGRTPAPGTYTSDIFAWHARDGRDFLLACGGGTRGQVVSYDMSEATSPRTLDTMSLDGKSVIDCVVDPETGIAAAVREGANGRGAITLFDASDARALKTLGTVDEGLGAIAGIATYKRHIFAVSDAHRLDIVSTEDPAHPRRTGSIELGLDAGGGTKGSASPSDVWVSDGIAYVAIGRSGLAVVDVGNGKFGGSPSKPVRVGGFHAPFASTHAAYGYRSRTGKWYVVTSEDLGAAGEGVPGSSAAGSSMPGFARIIDFTDPEHPEEVARYEVPEAGVQDLWIDGERLYVAAQNGGLRVVDISADLKGNLYYQGREVARFLPGEATGSTPNVVAVQSHRGTVLVADRNSGVWVVKVSPRD